MSTLTDTASDAGSLSESYTWNVKFWTSFTPAFGVNVNVPFSTSTTILPVAVVSSHLPSAFLDISWPSSVR